VRYLTNTGAPRRALASELPKARETQPTRVPPAPAHRHDHRLPITAEIDRVRAIPKCRDLEAPEPAVLRGAGGGHPPAASFLACGGVGQSATSPVASGDIVESCRTTAGFPCVSGVQPYSADMREARHKDGDRKATHGRWLESRNRRQEDAAYRDEWRAEQCGMCEFWDRSQGGGALTTEPAPTPLPPLTASSGLSTTGAINSAPAGPGVSPRTSWAAVRPPPGTFANPRASRGSCSGRHTGPGAGPGWRPAWALISLRSRRRFGAQAGS
jgi:hypothetical protein